MEQGDGHESGSEEAPYTVVVQIPNPYGETSDPIYVFGSNQGGDQAARMTELYRAVNSVQSNNIVYVQGAGDEENLTEESGDTVTQDLAGDADGTVGDEDHTMALIATPIRIIAHPHAKSFVWQHFGFVPLGDTDTPDRRRVLCRLCLRELPYCGNTTNLGYHLQRYHRDVVPPGVRELKPSARTGRRASRLPEPIGDPGQLIVVEATPEARRRGNYSRRVANSSLLTPSVSLGENEMLTQGSTAANNQWHWHASKKQQLSTLITKALVTDCLPTNTVEGLGFQSIIRQLDSSFEFQSALQFRSQVLPSLHQEERKRISSALSSVEYCSLTLDMWRNKEVELCYVGVACHYVNPEWVVDSKYLATLELSETQDADELSRRLQRLMSEWRLQQRWAMTGCTAAESSELSGGTFRAALSSLHLPHVPCLAAAMQQAANKAMQTASVEPAVRKVRQLLAHIQRTADLRVKLQERLAVNNLAALPLYLPRVASWFQVYTVLQRLQAGREVIQAVLAENRDDVATLLPSAKETLVLDAMQSVLRPLNEAADTLNADSYPSVSLVLPLLFKLTQVNLAESPDDNALLSDLKNVARGALRTTYEREETQQLLRMAMFLDPRLKRLPFFSKQEKASVQLLIRKELVKLIKKQGGGSTTTANAYRGATTGGGKKPKLAVLLEDIFAVPSSNHADDEAEHKESMPQQVSLPLPENVAQSELQFYDNEEAVSLEEPQPLRWWKAREGQYKYLSKLACRLLCIAATAIPMRRLLTPEGQAWTERRAVLPSEDVADVLFLSYNYGGTAALGLSST